MRISRQRIMVGGSRAHAPEMIRLPGGTFLMGSNDFYPEESPTRRVKVGGFWIDACPVTVEEFRRFVDSTGYVTLAERKPDPANYPGVDLELLEAGSLVFRKAGGPVDLEDFRQWWAYVPGATWYAPGGPQSTVQGREDHPVTHVAHEDAEAYAAWAGKALPTEAEWEFAARGGLYAAIFTWGDEFAPGGLLMANTWQGDFPWQNLESDGYAGTSPVGSFPANGYGLYDMAGNVWEWTADDYVTAHQSIGACPSCTPMDLAGAAAGAIPAKVIKGGSHLCAPNYCFRYRPAARQSQDIDTSTCHIGFRCVVRGGEPPPVARRNET